MWCTCGRSRSGSIVRYLYPNCFSCTSPDTLKSGLSHKMLSPVAEPSQHLWCGGRVPHLTFYSAVPMMHSYSPIPTPPPPASLMEPIMAVRPGMIDSIFRDPRQRDWLLQAIYQQAIREWSQVGGRENRVPRYLSGNNGQLLHTSLFPYFPSP